MIVQQHKDIDATEAKVMYGLSLKKMAVFAFSAAIVILLSASFHLPIALSGLIGGICMFFGIYKKQGMSAPVLAIRLFKTAIMKPTYCREKIAHTTVKTKKQQQKAAVAWNRELLRQKKRHPEMEMIKTVRCSRNKKTRK